MAEDLASLDSIDTSNVMKTLETRFHDKQIYTKNGSVLIAINPYQDVGALYDQTRLQRYKASMAIDKEAPHIFAVAGASWDFAAAIRCLVAGSTTRTVSRGQRGLPKGLAILMSRRHLPPKRP